MARVAVHLLITGRVQGVGYRAWMARETRRRDLAGWVRNRQEGGVEAVVIGDAVAVEAMIEACRRGPALARVDQVARDPAMDDGAADFEQRATA